MVNHVTKNLPLSQVMNLTTSYQQAKIQLNLQRSCMADDYNPSAEVLVYTEPDNTRDFPTPRLTFEPVSCDKIEQVL